MYDLSDAILRMEDTPEAGDNPDRKRLHTTVLEDVISWPTG